MEKKLAELSVPRPSRSRAQGADHAAVWLAKAGAEDPTASTTRSCSSRKRFANRSSSTKTRLSRPGGRWFLASGLNSFDKRAGRAIDVDTRA